MASRRAVLRGAAIAVAGAAAGAVAAGEWAAHRRPPLGGGYAAAADALGSVLHPGTGVTYYVQTDEPVVAFTFDDGPAPQWTPMVLDVLAEHGVPATFFLVGRNVARHGRLLRGRLDGHEVGNHSWSHPDLATLDLARVQAQLLRTHAAILAATGRQPRLLRPPFGHLGGSTLLAATAVGYEVVLWSQQMRERRYRHDPDGQVRDIVDHVRPGTIILAHDVGERRRLVALRRLGQMFTGLRERGYRFATVSDLMSLGPSGSRAPASEHLDEEPAARARPDGDVARPDGGRPGGARPDGDAARPDRGRPDRARLGPDLAGRHTPLAAQTS